MQARLQAVLRDHPHVGFLHSDPGWAHLFLGRMRNIEQAGQKY